MVNQKGKADGITGELAVLGGTPELAEPYHAVLVDRISHEVPYYRAHLKSAVLMGAVVVNDPFWWEADEKFFECTLARRLGVAVPRTVVLPNKEYMSSPFWAGRDTGLQSYRSVIWSRFPRTGIPPEFTSYDEYENYLELLVKTGSV